METLFGPLDRPVRLAVFLSGGGRTLVNLFESIDRGELDAEVVVVVSDRVEAGVKSHALPRREFESAADWSDAAFAVSREVGADLVVLAGFLSLVVVPEDFHLRVMNIHPSLIPAFCGHGFYGHHVHQAAIERGVKVSGCTVHFADNEYDHGPIVLQKVVAVEDGDAADDLAARVFAAECEAYPEAIRLFASGRLRLADGRLQVD